LISPAIISPPSGAIKAGQSGAIISPQSGKAIKAGQRSEVLRAPIAKDTISTSLPLPLSLINLQVNEI
jgi:hypothetical protein